MRVQIDSRPTELAVRSGQTFGGLFEQVRARLAEQNRVLAGICVDGQAVPADQLDDWLARPCDKFQVVSFTSTCPRELARQTIREVSSLFAQSSQLQQAAAEKLAAGQVAKAMEQLAGCLGLYKAAQQAVSQAVLLNSLDLDRLRVGDRSAADVMGELAGRLSEVKTVLDARDMVLLGDLIVYEFPNITGHWLAILAELEKELAGPAGAGG